QGPLPGVLIGAVATVLIQSSSATLGIVIVMASQGLVPLETGIAIALGASIGTAVTTMLATIGRPPVALRAGLVHVVFNGIGVGIALPLIPWIAEAAVAITPTTPLQPGVDAMAANSPRQIANAYTIAKGAMLLAFLPFTHQLAQLVERLVPVRASEARTAPKYLDEAVLATPAVALHLAHLEVTRLARRSLQQIERAVPTVVTGSAEQLTQLAEDDEEIDDLYDAIISYLRQIDDSELTEAQGDQLLRLMDVARYSEIVADLVPHELVRVGLRRLEEGVPVSDETIAVVGEFHRTMTGLYAEAIEAFATSDAARAQCVLEAKPEVSQLLEEAARHHAHRLGADAPQRVAAFARGTETIEHLRRIYTYAKRVARSVPGVDDEQDEIEP
ncbi:MAG: Na/Pi cotransporter family protein, partial [Actinomycetota bacterium]